MGILEIPLLVLVGAVIEVRFTRPLCGRLISQFFAWEVQFIFWLTERSFRRGTRGEY